MLVGSDASSCQCIALGRSQSAAMKTSQNISHKDRWQGTNKNAPQNRGALRDNFFQLTSIDGTTEPYLKQDLDVITTKLPIVARAQHRYAVTVE